MYQTLRNRVTVLALSYFLWGCAAGIPLEVPVDRAAAIKHIGIVAALGDDILRTHQGFIIYMRRETPVPAPELGLNALAQQLAKDAIDKGGRRAAILSSSITATRLLKENGRALNTDAVRQSVSEQVASASLDALLVIFPAKCRAPNPRREAGVTGPAGVYSEGGDDVVGMISPYACYSMQLLDAKDFSTIALFDGTGGADMQFGMKNRMSDKLWIPHTRSIPPEYRELVLGEIKRIMDKSVPGALAIMKLAPN